ncbi:phosphatidate cytidylyltransferase [Desulforhopalus singaporensis]|uniref:Phosphatidate cytidylyltransferase n=1 Tax=Desulforhopalus singaporensis TaxID=91360 RepID=A0A1H0RDY9_9BACT|nr:phosphatidate cytidylyltransferase [Desulforhopalus singaporensis]SDP27399.1 phosphatidate cytidylyltransferase [Desulforhopalus singaporensis]
MKRIVPGLLIAGLWLMLLLFGSIQLFSLLFFVIAMIGADEYLRMADRRDVALGEKGLLIIFTALPVGIVGLCGQTAGLGGAVLLSFAGFVVYLLCRYGSPLESYALFARFVFGLLYVGFLGSHLVLLRSLEEGGTWLIIASAITACSDTGAYYTGKRLGKRKLCPAISPNKTVEGAVGGVVSGTIGALVFGVVLLNEPPLVFLALGGAFLSLVGISGDLTESIIKRGTQTKDSGRLLAGHGGVLDRMDSLLFVAPALYYLLILLVP